MASSTVYTMDGPARARRRRKGGGRTAQQNRFKAAAKECAGQSQRAFRACMRRKLG